MFGECLYDCEMPTIVGTCSGAAAMHSLMSLKRNY